MKTAIIHYWLINMRGGEKVLNALLQLLPHADVFTLFHDPEKIPAAINRRVVKTSYLQPLRKHHRKLLPLMPMALESFDLSEYDLVISSESGPAKGVIVKSSARHVCYCHTPMRYLWELYPEYRNRPTLPGWQRALMDPLSHYLRMWDYASAARVDEFIANSDNVRRRIHRAYRRDASVIHPPVEVETFWNEVPEDYHLVVSELVPYKRVDAAVRVFAQRGQRLKIVGDGPEYKRLRAMASA
ncbi:MAG: glycosyltransferase, partial [Acidobacteriaceae bacterium]|nr:glycosyltransferase [Acidobacteriaceae bacterium]